MTNTTPHLQLRLYEFATALVAAKELSEAVALFSTELRFFGIEGYACGEVDLDDPGRTAIAHAQWSAAWLDYYLGERLHESDPLIARLRGAMQPFTWDETWNTLEAKRWREAVLSFGWRSGLAVPFPRGNGQVGLISLTSMQAPLSNEENGLLATTGALFYEHMRGFGAYRTKIPPPELTQRERECLKHVASGLDDPAIAKKLGIAASTVHEHVERAKRKLCARTRAQATALAVATGIINV